MNNNEQKVETTTSSLPFGNNHVVGSASPELGLYDSRNGNSVTAYKMFDATSLCTDSERCVIKYADVTRGRIAQICDWYKPDYDLGVNVHYHINEMTVEELANDEVFACQCRVMGADAITLAKAIFDNQ